MDLFSQLHPLQAALDYHLERHSILAANIAHVDTPGYVPRDLARVPSVDFAQTFRVAVATTNPFHLHAGSLGGPSSGRVFEDRWEGAGSDHNFVSLDREAAKLSANQVRYDVTTAIITAELAQLSFAAHDARLG